MARASGGLRRSFRTVPLGRVDVPSAQRTRLLG